MDTQPTPLESTNNNNNHHAFSFAFHHPRHHDHYAEEAGNLRRDIDNVRMNLNAELAELRQRRTVAEQQISVLMDKAMMFYAVVIGIRSIVALFRKKENRSKDIPFFRSLAVQLGTYAASRALLHYKNRQNQIAKIAPKAKLLTDSASALKEWKEPRL